MGALPVTSMPLNQMPGSPNASTCAVSSVPAAPLAAANPNEACNADSSSSKCILGASSVVTVVNDSHTGAVGGSNAILNDSVKDYSSRFAAGAAWPQETFQGLCLVLEDPEQGRKERTVKAITQCMRRVAVCTKLSAGSAPSQTPTKHHHCDRHEKVRQQQAESSSPA